MTFKNTIRRIPLGISPLLAVMGCAVSGASFFAYHSLTGPEIGLTKSQRQPFYVGEKSKSSENHYRKLYKPTKA